MNLNESQVWGGNRSSCSLPVPAGTRLPGHPHPGTPPWQGYKEKLHGVTRKNSFLQVPGLRHGKIKMIFQVWGEEDEERQVQRAWDQLRREKPETVVSQRDDQGRLYLSGKQQTS